MKHGLEIWDGETYWESLRYNIIFRFIIFIFKLLFIFNYSNIKVDYYNFIFKFFNI